MGGIIVLPELDYKKIGQRIKTARLEKHLTQAELGEMVGCSNNHMSHVEVGQTKVSLPMLAKISYVLEKELQFFVLGTPYAGKAAIVDQEIAEKLKRCDAATLVSVSNIIDTLLDQQKLRLSEDE